MKWEKGTAFPNAMALVAFADAGADVLYILTGRRTAERSDNPATQIEDQLASIRRDLLEPAYDVGEEAERAEASKLWGHTNALAAMLNYDAPFLTPEVREQAESLHAIVTNPSQIAAFRAADHIQRRAKRREAGKSLTDWYEGAPYQPGPAVVNMLTTLAMDYAVSPRLLSDLVIEIGEELEQREAIARSMEPRR